MLFVFIGEVVGRVGGGFGVGRFDGVGRVLGLEVVSFLSEVYD